MHVLVTSWMNEAETCTLNEYLGLNTQSRVNEVWTIQVYMYTIGIISTLFWDNLRTRTKYQYVKYSNNDLSKCQIIEFLFYKSVWYTIVLFSPAQKR